MRGVRGPNDPKVQQVDPTFVRGKDDAELKKFHQAGVPEDPLVGKMISGRYKVIEMIGQGGMGSVYLGEDTRLNNKKVAIKVLPAYFGKKSQIAERFVQEAMLAPRIEHENIIDITDRGKTADGVPYFVMEVLRGSDLSGVMVREGIMQWNDRTKEILLQICRGLSAAHEKGIVHRDMKPENIFLVERSDNRVFIKLFDFGIAKLLESATEETDDDEIAQLFAGAKSGMTQAGSVMGTPQYMAPEQAVGKEIDHRVDVYAVGTIMYEILCGRVPFVLDMHENPMADALRLLEMQKNEPPIPPHMLRPDLNIQQDVEAVIMTALAKNRDERFPTMKVMEAAIAALSVPQVEQQPASRTLLNGQASIKNIRPGSKSATGYLEILKTESARRKNAIRKAVIIAVAAAAIGSAVAGMASRSSFGRNYQSTPDGGNVKHSQMINDQDNLTKQKSDRAIGLGDGRDKDVSVH